MRNQETAAEDGSSLRAGMLAPALAVLVGVCWVLFHPDTPRIAARVSLILGMSSSLIGLALAVWPVSRNDQRKGNGWVLSTVTLLSISLLFRNLGNGFDLVDEFFHGGVKPYAALADIGFMGHNPIKSLAVVMVARAVLGWRERLRMTLDALLPVVAATTLVWYLLLGPLFLHPGTPHLGGALLTFYSMLTLFNLFLLAVIWYRFPDPDARVARIMLGFSLFASAFSNVSWQYLALRGSYAVGSTLDAGWMVADITLGAATWLFRRAPAPRQPTEVGKVPLREPPRVVLLFLPYLLIISVVVLSALSVLRGEASMVALGVHFGAAAVIVLVFVRQVLVLLENRRLMRALNDAYEAEISLNDALEQARADLEQRVKERTLALQRSEAELRQLNLGLETEVNARTQELRMLNRELEKFAYSVSHDLRAPLRAIDGFSALLEKNELEHLSDKGQVNLTRIRSAVKRMHLLLEGLLELSRLQQATITITEVDLSAMALEIAQELRDNEPHRHVEVVVAPGLVVHADRRLIHSVLQNLLNNAFKFTGKTEDPRIEVGRGDDDDEIIFIKDNGVGFDMRYADKLFGVFQRLHTEQEFPGTGVGLATVQRIIANHGGRVWVVGKPGEGATVSFTLGSNVAKPQPKPYGEV